MKKNKEKVKTKGSGKLSIIGQDNLKSENNYLRKAALKDVQSNNEYEATHEFVKIPIHRGFKMVKINKYLKNKKYYDSLINSK